MVITTDFDYDDNENNNKNLFCARECSTEPGNEAWE